MRNYIKINVSAVTMFFNGGANSTVAYFFWHNDDPDYLTELIARYQANIVLAWDGRNDVQTVVKYQKMNVQELLDAQNLIAGGGTPAAVWQKQSETSEYADLLRSIFVDKSPRKKE